VLIDLTVDVCMDALSNVPNSQKTFVCSYVSLFSLIAMQDDLRAHENADLTSRRDDYCENLKTGVD